MSTDIEDIAANTKIVNFLKEIENGKSIDQSKRKYKLHYKNNVLLTKVCFCYESKTD